VTEGQWVEVGQVIGHAGMTGMVTWPHLHFEVALGDKKFDPMRFLGKVVDVRTLHAEAVGKKPRVKRTRR
ncbi:MAG: M23 family metallopeptidase, partial [Myxococcota bacterium]